MADTLMSRLVEALAEMPNPIKNSDNPAFKRNGKPMRYADLEATLEACKPILAANGIAVMQMPVSGDGGVGVRTILIGHGEQMDCGSFVLPIEGQTPQKAGGAISYARRYALTSLFGLAQEDDDANGASTKPQPPAAQPDPQPEVDVQATRKEWDAVVSAYGDDPAKRAAVMEALGNPKSGKAAIEAFAALPADQRGIVLVKAMGGK